jgi:hypothetical protein
MRGDHVQNIFIRLRQIDFRIDDRHENAFFDSRVVIPFQQLIDGAEFDNERHGASESMGMAVDEHDDFLYVATASRKVTTAFRRRRFSHAIPSYSFENDLFFVKI